MWGISLFKFLAASDKASNLSAKCSSSEGPAVALYKAKAVTESENPLPLERRERDFVS